MITPPTGAGNSFSTLNTNRNGLAGLGTRVPTDGAFTAVGSVAERPAGATVAEVRQGHEETDTEAMPTQTHQGDQVSGETLPITPLGPTPPGKLPGGQEIQAVEQMVQDVQKTDQKGQGNPASVNDDLNKRYENVGAKGLLNESSLPLTDMAAEASVRAQGSNPLEIAANQAFVQGAGAPEAFGWYDRAVRMAQDAIKAQPDNQEARRLLHDLVYGEDPEREGVLQKGPEALGIALTELQSAFNKREPENLHKFMEAVRGWNTLLASVSPAHNKTYISNLSQLQKEVKLPDAVEAKKRFLAQLRELRLDKDSAGNVLVVISWDKAPARATVFVKAISEAMINAFTLPVAALAKLSRLAFRTEPGPDMSTAVNMPGTESAREAFDRAYHKEGRSLFASFWIAARQFGTKLDQGWLRLLDSIWKYLHEHFPSLFHEHPGPNGTDIDPAPAFQLRLRSPIGFAVI